MRLFPAVAIATLLVTTAVPCSQAAGAQHRSKTGAKTRTKASSGTKRKKTSAQSARPRAMEDSRAIEIQNALVKAGYLKEASGHWDSDSQAAMQKMQSDNGWQTKIVPDSRAIIKLGLGPNNTSANMVPVSGTEPAEESQTKFGTQ